MNNAAKILPFELPADIDLSSEDESRLRAEIAAEAKREAIEIAELSKQRHAQRALGRAAIPPRFARRNFENYQTESQAQAKALEICKRYAEGFSGLPISEGSCLMLIGNTGTGKTHLGAAIANNVIAQGYRAVFTLASSMIDDIRNTWGGRGIESDAVKKFVNPDLLIIDDVGSSADTDSVRDLFFKVINARYEQVKPTIITSNLTIEEFENAVGSRVVDRMREAHGMSVVFSWESKRGVL